MKVKKATAQSVEAPEASARKGRLKRRVSYAILVCLVLGGLIMTYKAAIYIEPGMVAIEANQDSHVPRYQLGVSLQHYFSGTPLQIRFSIKTLTDVYSDALKEVYCLLDSRTVYSDLVNLASINDHRDLELRVDPELYELLRQADALTRGDGSYNLYAGALYAEWEDLRYLVEPEEADPTRDPDEAERLERLSAATADLSNFSLEFLDDEACKLRFSVEPDYLELLEELELSDAPILDLNVLANAFKLQLVAKRLEEKHFDCGFLCSDDGLALALSAFDQPGSFTLYGLGEEGPEFAALCDVTAGSAAVSLRSFPLAGEEGYYSVEQDGQSLGRGPWLPADGKYRKLLYSALVCSERQSLVESVCYAMRLIRADSAAELKTLAAAHGAFDTALLLQDQPRTVRSEAEKLQVNTQAGYRLEGISSLK